MTDVRLPESEHFHISSTSEASINQRQKWESSKFLSENMHTLKSQKSEKLFSTDDALSNQVTHSEFKQI